jgi:hypothetical protein
MNVNVIVIGIGQMTIGRVIGGLMYGVTAGIPRSVGIAV